MFRQFLFMKEPIFFNNLFHIHRAHSLFCNGTELFGNDAKFARLRRKGDMGKKRKKKMGENARRDGWHFKSPDRFARLNKSNGAHPRVESRREEKEIYEERSKKDGRRTTGRSGRKGGQSSDPPTGPDIRNRGFSTTCLSRGGIGRGERENLSRPSS